MVDGTNGETENVDLSHVPLRKQFEYLNDATKAPLLRNEIMCLLSVQWVQQFERFVHSHSSLANAGSNVRPPPIDNGPLLDDPVTGELRSGLMEESDYKLVPIKSWNQLVSWCGSLQPPIERKVIEDGSLMPRPIVEVYPLAFNVFTFADRENYKEVALSRVESLSELKRRICETFAIDATDMAKVRLWGGPDNRSFSEFSVYEKQTLDHETSTRIDKTPLMHDKYIMVEEQVGGSWPNDAGREFGKHTISNSPSLYSPTVTFPGSWPSKRYEFSPERSKRTHGVTGLMNLGNTCFMNSALQCLSNTKPLTQYFLDGTYKSELNVDNPLGMHGDVAEAYGQVVNRVWRENEDSIPPRDFKYTIGQFAPQFVGYQQHDSQELAGFLLDGLHEDLNRIKKKPYMETPDYDGKISDAEFAEKLWSIHKARNDSVIVDHFQGQYKSTLVCPECEKVSITFDPYMYLSLPLPIQKKTWVSFTFVPSIDSKIHSKPIKETIMIKGDTSTIGDFKKAVAGKYGVPVKNLIVIEEFSNSIYKRFTNDDMIKDIGRNDIIFVFECLAEDKPLPKKVGLYSPTKRPVSDAPEAINIPVYLYRADEYRNPVLFTKPFFVTVVTKMTLTSLYDLLLEYIQRFIKIDVEKFVDASATFEEPESKNEMDSRDEQEPPSSDGDKPLFQIGIKTSDVATSPTYKPTLADDGSLTLDPQMTLCATFDKKTISELFSPGNSLFDDIIEVAPLQREDSRNETTDLNACFDEFSKEENLSEQDAWYCPQCQKHQQATKKLDIWKVPDILVIHLKRFSHSRYRRDKIENMIDYPITDLDLTAMVQGPQKDEVPLLYDLYAISNHMGGLGGGHYTAYAKNAIDGKWYDFDDSRVTEISEDSVRTHMAYMLFYQKRNSNSAKHKLVISPQELAQVIATPALSNPAANGSTTSMELFSDTDSTTAVIGDEIEERMTM